MDKAWRAQAWEGADWGAAKPWPSDAVRRVAQLNLAALGDLSIIADQLNGEGYRLSHRLWKFQDIYDLVSVLWPYERWTGVLEPNPGYCGPLREDLVSILLDRVEPEERGQADESPTRFDDPPPLSYLLGPVCETLATNPLFHLSLNSKDVFHSNLLAWFADRYPSEADAAFKSWASPRPGTPHRAPKQERKGLDLVLYPEDAAPLVIENEVFGPPDQGQLARRANETKSDQPALILLTLFDPEWIDESFPVEHGTWRRITYTALAAALDPAASILVASADDERRFAGQLLTRYAKLCRTLDRLARVATCFDINEPLDLDDESRQCLQNLQVHDAVGRLRARASQQWLEGHTALPARDLVEWESHFTNGTSLLAAFVTLESKDKLYWQYQGGQFRLAVKVADPGFKLNDEVTIKARHAYVLARYAQWFDFTPLADMVGYATSPSPAEIEGTLNRYNSDFAYRYRRLPNLTATQLLALSDHYLGLASRWPAA
jgi:hypothetical protein